MPKSILFRSCAAALCIVSQAATVNAQDTDAAQCFAKNSKGFVNALRLLAILAGKDTFAIDRTEELNDARAQAEMIMNDPTHAFLGGAPAPEQGSAEGAPAYDVRSPCPARPLICNPIGTPATVVSSGNCVTFSVECYEKTSDLDAYFTYGDCIYRDGRFTFVKRGGEHELFYQSIVKFEGSAYPGQTYASFCQPCGVAQP